MVLSIVAPTTVACCCSYCNCFGATVAVAIRPAAVAADAAHVATVHGDSSALAARAVDAAPPASAVSPDGS